MVGWTRRRHTSSRQQTISSAGQSSSKCSKRVRPEDIGNCGKPDPTLLAAAAALHRSRGHRPAASNPKVELSGSDLAFLGRRASSRTLLSFLGEGSTSP